MTYPYLRSCTTNCEPKIGLPRTGNQRVGFAHFDDERRGPRQTRLIGGGGEGELLGVHDPPVTETFENLSPRALRPRDLFRSVYS